jgi:Ca2+/Na+ antiporter
VVLNKRIQIVYAFLFGGVVVMNEPYIFVFCAGSIIRILGVIGLTLSVAYIVYSFKTEQLRREEVKRLKRINDSIEKLLQKEANKG